MNRSIVITRYARALEKYVRETGSGPQVSLQAQTLLRALHDMPQLRRAVTASQDVVSAQDKLKLLQGALDGKVAPELLRFLSLLSSNARMDLLEDILRDFLKMHSRSEGQLNVRLTAVNQPSEEMLERLKDLVKQKTGADALIEVEVDPSLVGGFILDIDNYLLDASIKRQLDLIREQFIERNRRII